MWSIPQQLVTSVKNLRVGVTRTHWLMVIVAIVVVCYSAVTHAPFHASVLRPASQVVLCIVAPPGVSCFQTQSRCFCVFDSVLADCPLCFLSRIQLL